MTDCVIVGAVPAMTPWLAHRRCCQTASPEPNPWPSVKTRLKGHISVFRYAHPSATSSEHDTKMKHWRLEDVAWDAFDPDAVDPALVPLVKAAAMVERNGRDYALYLGGVFHDDPDFRNAADYWAEEEVQHGDALARWAERADPGWNF